MTDSERLANIERRQEALVASVNDFTLIMGMNNTLLTEIKNELSKPAPSGLSDLLRELVQTMTRLADKVEDQKGMIVKLGGRVGEIPHAVARAMQTGEVV